MIGPFKINVYYPQSESDVINDFKSNMEIRVNGEIYKESNTNNSSYSNSTSYDYSDTSDVTPIDPDEFFKSSNFGKLI